MAARWAVRHLQLACDSRNTSALAFYEAQGMQRKLIQFRKKL